MYEPTRVMLGCNIRYALKKMENCVGIKVYSLLDISTKLSIIGSVSESGNSYSDKNPQEFHWS